MTTRLHFSIIIPFFNEMPYIRQAVDSCQTSSSFQVEVLIINDNPELASSQDLDCFQFPENVRIVTHQGNRGLQAARNTGIREARGDFIAFLDSDDYFLPDRLEECMAFALEEKSDITHFQTYIRSQGSGRLNTFCWDAKYYSEATRLQGDNAKLYGINSLSTWSSFYRREFLVHNDLYGDERQRKYEDRLFVVQTMLAANSISNFPKAIRVSRRRANSITTSPNSDSDIKLKSEGFVRIVEAIIHSACSEQVRRMYLIQDVALFFSQLFTGGTDKGYQSIYLYDDTENAAAARMRIADAIGKIDRRSLQEPIRKNANSRLKVLMGRRAPRLTGVRFEELWESVETGKAENVRTAILERTPQGYIHRKTAKHLEPKGNVDYIIHLGAHKTGTTEIQTACFQAKSHLESKGVLFPHTGFGGTKAFRSVKKGGVPGHSALRHALINNDRKMIDALAQEIDRSGCSTVLLSAENVMLSLYGGDSDPAFEEFFEMILKLPRINSVRFVLAVREPVAWMDSLFREYLATGRKAALLVKSPDEFALTNIEKLDFCAVISRLQEFSKAPVVVIDFDKAKETDLLANFFHEVFEDFGTEILRDFPRSELFRYPAISDANFAVLFMLKELVRDNAAYKSIAREYLDRASDEGGKHILFSPAIQRMITKEFSERNECLSPVLPDKDLHPDVNTEINATDRLAVPSFHLELLSEILSRPHLVDGKIQSDDEIAMFVAQQPELRIIRPIHIALVRFGIGVWNLVHRR